MIGRVLGNRYEIVEKLGEGGMATVYKARCQILNRFVSVKILKKEYSSDEEFLKKFRREATAVASLSDNNIVNVYDVGVDGDINYIVMEYVEGKSLKEILNERGKLSTDQALAVGIQIGKALEHAHKNNIVHRDIKPHNVLVTNDGVVKVTDFGIAKSSDSVTITNSSKVLGSAHYFSPEQAKGNVVDNRTDIYSLGIVLYELVTGRVPFDAESPVSIALKHIQEPVVPPIQLNENIPDALNKLIMKAVEKEPFRRYQNVSDMVADMKAIQQNKDLRIVANDFEQDATRVLDVKEINSKLTQKVPEVTETPVEKRVSKINKNKGRKKMMVAAILILLALVGAVSGYYAFNKVAGNNADITVPAIVGLQESAAKKLVEDSNLKFVVVSTDKSSETEGTVIRCYPEVGTKVKKDSDVRVSISGGINTSSTVPTVNNMELTAAKKLITDSGFTVGTITYQTSTALQKDYVISQSPEPGSTNSTDKTIDLVVSSGAVELKYSTVPDLHGKTVVEASAILANAVLKLGSTDTAVTDNVALKDTIKSQSIDPGQKVTEGTSISVTYYVYQAPAVTQVAVPSITYIDGADEQLAAVGLAIGKTTKETTTDQKLDGQVKSTSPAVGTMVNNGTKVDIVYYEYKAQGQ